jgi:HD-GYP domain-containing protein (c-di-GMP phosphodiesterase class II)
MRKVDVFSLQPGMKVAKAVYSGMGDVLLKAGATINSVYIKKLIKLGAAFVYVEGEEEGEAFSGVEAKDVIARETRVAAVQQVRSVLLKSKEAGQLVIEPQSLYSTVSEFTRQLLDNSSLTYSLVDLRTQDDYTFAHSVNVSVLALMTGITLGFSRDRLSHLGVGGMLHDLGKVKVPDVILNKPGPLTRDEFAVMKQHTRLGYEMIRAFDSLGEATALIAYQHHEHFNGTGYPLGISGDEFNLNAQKDGECPEAISNFPAQETKGPASRVHPQPENTPGQEPV